MNFILGDELFETVAQHLLHKKQQLFDKFRILLLKQSMVSDQSKVYSLFIIYYLIFNL